MQSALQNSGGPHVAIILDGNGRWAAARGRPRSAGHRAGSRAVRRVVEAAVEQRVAVLTLFAFSSDNWRRPAVEVEALMGLFHRYLTSELDRCRENGVRLNVIGRRDRLSPAIVTAIREAEARTREAPHLLLRIAVDYSARQVLARAADVLQERRGARTAREPAALARFERALEDACHSVPGIPPVDLLIRTSGERRLSDFLLYECAYAELVFTPKLWPDFTGSDLRDALSELGRRERRFGALPDLAATAPRPGRSARAGSGPSAGVSEAGA